MSENKLQIIAADHNDPLTKTFERANKRKLETQALFERMWLMDPEQFNPLRNVMERERLERTWALVSDQFQMQNKLFADLGCGSGVFTELIHETGATVHAVDIASNALKLLRAKKLNAVQAIQEFVPQTSLKDRNYDGVFALELVAYLPHVEHRLFFSELRRLLKPGGFAVFSTSLDIDSEDALERFEALAESEFKIEKMIVSYHLLYIRLRNFFDAPARFVKGNQDKEYFEKELGKRISFSKWWFRINCQRLPSLIWSGVKFFSNPIARHLKQSKAILINLEKICKFFWSDSGISHTIVLGTLRPLVEMPLGKDMPIERRHKKEVWE
jgi:2-polyprenyl-3-methyl-5-hydroxy-6-metoxy-1,4-benzoquinol methylase